MKEVGFEMIYRSPLMLRAVLRNTARPAKTEIGDYDDDDASTTSSCTTQVHVGLPSFMQREIMRQTARQMRSL